MASAAVAAACWVLIVPGAFDGRGASGRWVAAADFLAELEAAVRAAGCATRRVAAPPDGTLQARALALRDQADAWRVERGGTAPTRLLAQSLGGLDARWALADQPELRAVDRVVTVGTPHEGAQAADWLWARREGFWGEWVLRRLVGYDPGALGFLPEVTREGIAARAARLRARPDVRYAAARLRCRTACSWALQLAGWLFGAAPGDGLVTSEAQRFGEDLGEFDLDHRSAVDRSVGKAIERSRMNAAIVEFLRRP